MSENNTTVQIQNTDSIETINPEAQQFLGLTKKTAQDKAEKKNLIFRLIRIDDKSFFSYPTDVRSDRVCVEIDNGKISKAIFK